MLTLEKANPSRGGGAKSRIFEKQMAGFPKVFFFWNPAFLFGGTAQAGDFSPREGWALPLGSAGPYPWGQPSRNGDAFPHGPESF